MVDSKTNSKKECYHTCFLSLDVLIGGAQILMIIKLMALPKELIQLKMISIVGKILKMMIDYWLSLD